MDKATEKLLDEGKSPSRKVGEIDNRGSHFYLAMYWAQELAAQSEESELAEHFAPIAEKFSEAADKIDAELMEVQGEGADLGGYYQPSDEQASKVMRPSATYNQLMEELKK